MSKKLLPVAFSHSGLNLVGIEPCGHNSDQEPRYNPCRGISLVEAQSIGIQADFQLLKPQKNFVLVADYCMQLRTRQHPELGETVQHYSLFFKGSVRHNWIPFQTIDDDGNGHCDEDKEPCFDDDETHMPTDRFALSVYQCAKNAYRTFKPLRVQLNNIITTTAICKPTLDGTALYPRPMLLNWLHAFEFIAEMTTPNFELFHTMDMNVALDELKMFEMIKGCIACLALMVWTRWKENQTIDLNILFFFICV